LLSVKLALFLRGQPCATPPVIPEDFSLVDVPVNQLRNNFWSEIAIPVTAWINEDIACENMSTDVAASVDIDLSLLRECSGSCSKCFN
jgi:hypothetical protein